MPTKEEVLSALDNMSVLQVIALTKSLETLWGVEAKPLVVASVQKQTESVTAKTEFDVVLVSVPADKKMSVIKVVRDVLKLGLKESKDLVESAPKTVSEGVDAAEAASIQSQLTTAGAVIEVK